MGAACHLPLDLQFFQKILQVSMRFGNVFKSDTTCTGNDAISQSTTNEFKL